MAQARDAINPPVAVILPGNPLVPQYGTTMDGAVTLSLNILIIMSDAPTSERVQKNLDAYLGIGAGEAMSIPAAIGIDPSLGGTVAYCEPMSAGSYGRIEYAGETFFGSRITCQIGSI